MNSFYMVTTEELNGPAMLATIREDVRAPHVQAAVLHVFRAYVEEIRETHEEMGDWSVNEYTKGGVFTVVVIFHTHKIRTMFSAAAVQGATR